MPLEVVGAGVGRTGTASLKMALEQLLEGRCHHMLEIIGDPSSGAGVDRSDRWPRGGLAGTAG